MSPRLLAFTITQWLWCLLAIPGGPGSIAAAVTVRPPNAPATVEAQAKFFQDFFSVQLSPYKLEFGHVCEDPDTWEQRYEHKDLKNFRDMGKVRWGDKHGGYGEHYWDLNHAGSANKHATADQDDDHTKHDEHEYKHEANDPYDETVDTGDYNPNYGEGDEYDSEKLAQSDFSEENNRAKRAHVRTKAEKRIYRATEDDSQRYSKDNKESDEDEIDRELDEVLTQDVQKTNVRKARKSKPQHKPAIKELNLEEDPEEEEEEVEEEVTVKPKNRKTKDNPKVDTNTNEEPQKRTLESSQHNLYDGPRKANENYQPRQGRTVYNPYKGDVQRINENYGNRNLQAHYVPYEGGARHQADTSAAASAPFRLFLEPSTGHVIDRATGQAYVLQPLAPANNFDTYN